MTKTSQGLISITRIFVKITLCMHKIITEYLIAVFVQNGSRFLVKFPRILSYFRSLYHQNSDHVPLVRFFLHKV
jgi:hypothetical protein